MKSFTILLTLLVLTLNSFSQSLYSESRYRHALFNQVTAQNNVKYGEAPQWVWPYWNEDLYLNVYQPTGDIVPNRPLIIFAHAGGFLNGSKDVDDMVALCDSFARKGYVTATIDYRKGFNPLDAESAERAVYRGVQDGKAAVRYFKANASTYKIDTNYIYFGGMSAGGFITLHVAYMDLESERPASTFGGGTVNNLGCLDCSGGNTNRTSTIRAGLNYWGAIEDTTLIVHNDIPLLSMHGATDPTVPYIYGQPFGLGTLPYVYGSKPVTERLNNLEIYNEFYTSNTPGLHMLDGSNNGTFENPPTPFWYDTLLPRTTDFLVKMTKSNPTRVSPDTVLLCHNQTTNFEIAGNDLFYYRWTLFDEAGSTVLSQNTKNIALNFPSAGTYDLAVVEFNEVYCSSDTIWFHIMQEPEIITTPISNLQNSLCAGESIVLEVQAIADHTYTWFQDNATTSLASDSAQITLNFVTPGTYQIGVIATNLNGCSSDTIWFAIEQFELVAPTITGSAERVVCINEPHLFQVSGHAASTYEWTVSMNGASTIAGTNADSLNMAFTSIGNYEISVIETSANNCISTPIVFNVEVVALPIADFSYILSNYVYAVFTNNSTNAVNYSWDFGDGNTSTVQNPLHQYASNGTYTVTLTVENNEGCQHSTTQTININHLSINDIEAQFVSIYPNPVVDLLTINLADSKDLTLEITDLNGKIVVEKMIIKANSTSTIDTKPWHTGVYIVKMVDKNGAIIIRKIVK